MGEIFISPTSASPPPLSVRAHAEFCSLVDPEIDRNDVSYGKTAQYSPIFTHRHSPAPCPDASALFARRGGRLKPFVVLVYMYFAPSGITPV